MRNFKSTIGAFFAAALLMSTTRGFAADVGSPEAVKIKLYEFWVSPNTDCSDLTRIFSDTSAPYQNVAANVDFGQITVANGTYPCIAFKMGDVVKLTPDYDSDTGNCHQGVEITRDLFRVGDVSNSPTGTVINGSGTNPVGQIEDGMYVYLTTTGNNANTCTIPSDPCRLNTPYIVGGDNSAFFVFDFTNGIEDTGGSCSPETVTFGFRYQ